jgi:hypothetical protein
MMINRLLIPGDDHGVPKDVWDAVREEIRKNLRITEDRKGAQVVPPARAAVDRTFTPAGKAMLKIMRVLLTNLASMSNFFEGEKYPTLSAVFPLFCMEVRRLRQLVLHLGDCTVSECIKCEELRNVRLSPQENKHMCQFKEDLVTGMLKRFETMSTPTYIVATMLDPATFGCGFLLRGRSTGQTTIASHV